MAKTVQITFDCGDPAAMSAFWGVALGYVLQPPPEGFDDWPAALTAWGVPPELHNERSSSIDPDGVGPRLFFQRVPEGKTAKNRVHLDVRAAPGVSGGERMAALETEAERLVANGATRVSRTEPDEAKAEMGFIVMTDPEGNEFCLD